MNGCSRPAVEGEDGAVVSPDLGQWVAGHLLVDVALVDDDPVPEPAARDIDRPDLIGTAGIGVQVLHDIEGRAVR